MKKHLAIACLLLQTSPLFAGSWGAQFSVQPQINDHAEPVDLRGFRAAVRYLPSKDLGGHVHVYYEGSATNYRSDVDVPHESLSILGLSPVVRMSLFQFANLYPYFEFGIGGSWLSKSIFAARRLGGHWQFQDMAGIGAEFGKQNVYYMGLQVLHYSNAGLADYNRGITAPLLLTFGTRNFS